MNVAYWWPIRSGYWPFRPMTGAEWVEYRGPQIMVRPTGPTDTTEKG